MSAILTLFRRRPIRETVAAVGHHEHVAAHLEVEDPCKRDAVTVIATIPVEHDDSGSTGRELSERRQDGGNVDKRRRR